jgi:hypothetical protein
MLSILLTFYMSGMRCDARLRRLRWRFPRYESLAVTERGKRAEGNERRIKPFDVALCKDTLLGRFRAPRICRNGRVKTHRTPPEMRSKIVLTGTNYNIRRTPSSTKTARKIQLSSRQRNRAASKFLLKRRGAVSEFRCLLRGMLNRHDSCVRRIMSSILNSMDWPATSPKFRIQRL